MSASSVVIAGYARSPFTFAKKGGLARVRPDDLAAQVIRELIARTRVKPEDIEDIIMGCAFPEGEQGMNVGRLIALLSDLPISVAGMTVNRFCGSSMQSVHIAAGAIAMGAGEVFVCAGVESMSRVPARRLQPAVQPGAASAKQPGAYMSMGETAENVASQWQVPRAEQEAFAVKSHAKAAAAQAARAVRRRDRADPRRARDGGGEDGCIRPETSARGAGRAEARLRQGRVGDGGDVLAADRWLRGGAGDDGSVVCGAARAERRWRGCAARRWPGAGRRSWASARSMRRARRWRRAGIEIGDDRRGGAERGVQQPGASPARATSAFGRRR